MGSERGGGKVIGDDFSKQNDRDVDEMHGFQYVT